MVGILIKPISIMGAQDRAALRQKATKCGLMDLDWVQNNYLKTRTLQNFPTKKLSQFLV